MEGGRFSGCEGWLIKSLWIGWGSLRGYGKRQIKIMWKCVEGADWESVATGKCTVRGVEKED